MIKSMIQDHQYNVDDDEYGEEDYGKEKNNKLPKKYLIINELGFQHIE